MPAAPRAGGLRERNKADKLQKIRRAARELFIEAGYEDATVREIAQRAGIGLGTLFAYAADKRDLLFLIFNDELEAVTAAAFAELPDGLAFLDQLIAVFRRNYEFFGRQPRLAQFMLRELTFYGTGSATSRFHVIRERLTADLAGLVAAAQAAGRIGSAAAPATVARLIFAVYAIEIRRWVGEEPPLVEAGLQSLRDLLRLQILGLAPAPGALGTGRQRRPVT